MDNLKQVNDNYGHDVGDHCISALAQSLKLIINESDIIARVGGDEFIVVSTVEGEKGHRLFEAANY
ncbi:diguanylate cyclase [Vibrio sinaloensis]|nr:diguanylate cyclase [Vibrio sinaloensis]